MRKQRNKFLTIPATAKEHAAIKRYAKSTGMTFSAFSRLLFQFAVETKWVPGKCRTPKVTYER